MREDLEPLPVAAQAHRIRSPTRAGRRRWRAPWGGPHSLTAAQRRTAPVRPLMFLPQQCSWHARVSDAVIDVSDASCTGMCAVERHVAGLMSSS